jgi:hypothetical protein
MATHITWTNFGIAVLVILVSYYILLGIYCYAQEIGQIVKNKSQTPNPLWVADEEEDFSTPIVESSSIEEETRFQIPDDTAQNVEILIDQLKEGVVFASEHEYQELAYKAHLKSIIQQFPQLKESAYEPAINEFLIKECEKYGSRTLSEEEVMQLWNS